MQFLKESMLELIIQTSTNLPPDVRKAMAWALRTENPQTQAGQALAIIGENIDMAHEGRRRDLPGHGHARPSKSRPRWA